MGRRDRDGARRRLLLRAGGQPRLDRPGRARGLGALASLLVFAGGLWLHRRYGPTYWPTARWARAWSAVTRRSPLLRRFTTSSPTCVPAIAAGIGAVGLATSLLWGSELVAGIGLVGATLIPMMVLFEEDLSRSEQLAGIVFAATATVAVARWPSLIAGRFLASLPQIAIPPPKVT